MFEVGDLVRPNEAWQAQFYDKHVGGDLRNSIFEITSKPDVYTVCQIFIHASDCAFWRGRYCGWELEFLEKL